MKAFKYGVILLCVIIKINSASAQNIFIGETPYNSNLALNYAKPIESYDLTEETKIVQNDPINSIDLFVFKTIFLNISIEDGFTNSVNNTSYGKSRSQWSNNERHFQFIKLNF